MEYFLIKGKQPIQGEIVPQGNKNEALVIICASLLNSHRSVIKNVPLIDDIRHLLKILETLNAKIKIEPEEINTITIDTSDLCYKPLPSELVKLLRGSITLLAPILARFGKILMPRPGGDKIGRRRIDTHLLPWRLWGLPLISMKILII